MTPHKSKQYLYHRAVFTMHISMELPFEILSITMTKVMGKIVLCSNIGWNAWNGPYLAQ